MGKKFSLDRNLLSFKGLHFVKVWPEMTSATARAASTVETAFENMFAYTQTEARVN